MPRLARKATPTRPRRVALLAALLVWVGLGHGAHLAGHGEEAMHGAGKVVLLCLTAFVAAASLTMRRSGPFLAVVMSARSAFPHERASLSPPQDLAARASPPWLQRFLR